MLKNLKQHPLPIKKLILKLHPMQSQSMQKTLHCIHAQNNGKSNQHKNNKPKNYPTKTHKNTFTIFDSPPKNEIIKYFGQLTMC